MLGAIFGFVALNQIRRTGQKGKGLAIAGLCVSGLWVVVLAIGIPLAIMSDATRDSSGTITSEGDVSVSSLKAGDCIKTLKERSTVSTLPAVPCSQAHEAEVIGEFNLTGSSYPGENAIENQATKRCEDILEAYASDATIDLVEDFYFLYPRSSDWRRGDRTVTCLATTDPSHTGSLKG